jgi:hypothetical protein
MLQPKLERRDGECAQARRGHAEYALAFGHSARSRSPFVPGLPISHAIAAAVAQKVIHEPGASRMIGVTG